MINIKQTHNGSGDNVGGDKVVNEKTKSKDFALPIWAQWFVWVVTIFGVIWAVYTYFIK